MSKKNLDFNLPIYGTQYRAHEAQTFDQMRATYEIDPDNASELIKKHDENIQDEIQKFKDSVDIQKIINSYEKTQDTTLFAQKTPINMDEKVLDLSEMPDNINDLTAKKIEIEQAILNYHLIQQQQQQQQVQIANEVNSNVEQNIQTNTAAVESTKNSDQK